MIKRRNRSSAETDLTPMLDIVFILLIFFIVTAIFIKENAIDMTQPEMNLAEPVQQTPSILVRIDEDSLVRVNGRLSDIGNIRSEIERLLAAKPDQSVLVQAHPDARTRLVILAVDSARSAGVAGVGFALDQS